MGVLNFLSDIVKPVTSLIDSLHTSEAEKGQVKQGLVKLENSIASKVLEYESKLMESQAKVITAETQGASWLQRNWRPITMLAFLILVICDSFGLLTFRLSESAWTLLQLGLGGYVVGRSVEKIIKKRQP